MPRSFIFLALLLLFANSSAMSQEATSHFFRAINLNGPALVIDGNQWESGNAANLEVQGEAFENQGVTLTPQTDPNRAKMIRSSRWGQKVTVALSDVPQGTYQLFVYVWEDNSPEVFALELNGKTVVSRFNSGTRGQWKRLGPWTSTVNDGRLKLTASGGAANISGIEIWVGTGLVPDPSVIPFSSTPTEEQISFFESRIRPLLIENCYSCHSNGAEEIGGNLLLDSRAGIVKGGATGPLLMPGDPESSLLIRAVGYKDVDLKMPPNAKLADHQIADLAEWIRARAPDPRSEDTVAAWNAKNEIDWNEVRDFWSLRPLSKAPPPAVNDRDWPANPIDQYIAARLDQEGLTHAEEADRLTLIRRATFDLIGLPPTPEEIAAFLSDQTSDAFSKVIDRLLSSPHYGERWGRHWLDVVRYSDTAGDNSDFPIPQFYLYRNWVIDAFNRDLPYDQFVREQLAGDLIGGDSVEEKRQRTIATGYIANARRFGSRVDDYPQHLTIEDTIDNLGRTFLAMTINCARCHNHKFDPITSDDYYALYGIFHSTRYPWPGIELEPRQRDFATLADPAEVSQMDNERLARQKELDEVVKQLKKQRDAADDETRKALETTLKKAEKVARQHFSQPLAYETLYAVAEAKTIEDVAVQLKGDPTKMGDVVPRRFLSVLNGSPLVDRDQTSGRLQLANWIVDRNNPLTARVMANRVWQHHFGKAIVPTANDFGRHGYLPTHPELLDWLAQHFMDSGWAIKTLHRTIMLSRSYRMSSLRSAKAVEVDPANHLLSAFPRHRLSAEAIRDTLLLLGGYLDLTPAESHPFPRQSEWKFTQHNPFKAIYETTHRSVYLMTQRTQRHPYLAIFDGADPATSTPVRQSSTTPLQALYLLNDKFVHDMAEGLARRLHTYSTENSIRLERVWLEMFGRPPEHEESQFALSFLKNVQSELKSKSPNNESLELESWQALLRSLIRTNEFVYLD